jgi:DNA-binding NarL/FixJ family response regulator
MIQVAVVDDHPVARCGIEAILGEAGDIEVGLSTDSPTAVVEALQNGDEVDVLLLDLYHADDEPCMPLIGELKNLVKVLVVSASARPPDVLGAVRAGAAGYVTKLADPFMLVSAVRTVAAGGFALSAHLADMLQSELRGGTASVSVPRETDGCAPVTSLSPREEETLILIAQGFTHAQTATRMGVSPATVNTYVERIRAKLQVGNKAELTRAALRHFGENGLG